MKSLVVSAVIIGANLFGAAHADTIFGLSSTNPVPANQPGGDGNLDLGMNFTVNAGGLQVTSLGAYTNGSTPLNVGLFDLTNGNTEVAQGVVSSLAPGNANYGFVALGTPVALVQGHTYQIAAAYYQPGNEDFNPYEPNSNGVTATFDNLGGGLTFAGNFYNQNSGGAPAVALTQDQLSAAGYGAGTLVVSAVPLPAAGGLLLSALAGLGLWGRRRKPADAVSC